jgi:hypothetical protein
MNEKALRNDVSAINLEILMRTFKYKQDLQLGAKGSANLHKRRFQFICSIIIDKARNPSASDHICIM